MGYLTTVLTAGPAGLCDCALHWAERWGLTPTLDKGVRGVQWLCVCVCYGNEREKKRDGGRRSVRKKVSLCVSVCVCVQLSQDRGWSRWKGVGDMAARLRWNRWIRLAELSDRSITIKLSAQCLPLSALSLFLINRGIGLQFGLVPGQRGSLPCLSAAFSALWKEHKKGTNLPSRAFWVGKPSGKRKKGILPKNKVLRLDHNRKNLNPKHFFKSRVHWHYTIISHSPAMKCSHSSMCHFDHLSL